MKVAFHMRWFFGITVALLICFGVYIGSAIVSLNGLVIGARGNDAAELLARTDTARIRRSLVDQIVSAYLKPIGKDRPVKPLERLAANTYGATVADAMIAKMLTLESLTAVLSKGEVGSGAGVADMQSLTTIDTSRIAEMLKRMSPVKPVEFVVRLGDTAHANGVSIHFEGKGWKLSGIQLPSAAVQSLAQSLVDGRGGSG